MSDTFDPYYKWLDIPPEEQPADHYRLLGIEKFESDTKLIKKAAEAKIEYLRTFQLGKRFSFSQKLMAEVASARVCLLNSEKKAAYDAELRGHSETAQEKAPVGPPFADAYQKHEKIIGIDFGTTNSVVAVMEGNEAKEIANVEGNRLTPSVVAYTDKGETLVGEPARRQAVTNPTRTIYSIKRFMGRRHDEVESEEKMVPYEITGGPEDFVKIKVGDKEYTPPQVSALVLRKLKESAEAYLGKQVTKAVLTVPPFFNRLQRFCIEEAAGLANLEIVRILHSTTAAAVAYGLDKDENEKIVVYDLGGGTF